MVDLVGQYNKIKPEVDSAIQEILSTAAFINGPHVKSFQEIHRYRRSHRSSSPETCSCRY